MNENESIFSENLGFREPISSTTSYNGRGSRVCTEDAKLTKNDDNVINDRDASSIAFNTNAITIKIGEEYKPVINVSPVISNLPALTLISEDEDVAKITPEGVIIGVGRGETTVTAASSPNGMNSDPVVNATITVTVTK